MTHKQIVDHWLKSSKKDWQFSQELFQTKKFDYSLFFAHLALEKLLKGIYIKKYNRAHPITHNLSKLAKTIEVDLSLTEIKQLDEISRYNIAARYDNIKLQFYKQATPSYTKN